MNKFLALLKKDFLLHYKDMGTLLTTFFFSILLLLLFHFALENTPLTDIREKQNIFAIGIYWIVFFYQNSLFLQRSLFLDQQNQSSARILIAPVPRFILMLSKLASNWILCILLQLLLIPIFAVFFEIKFLTQLPIFFALLVFSSLGFCALGTLISALTVKVRFREVLIPLLLFPLAIPLLLASIRLSEVLLFSLDWNKTIVGLKILVAFDLIYLLLCWITYELILE